MAYGLKYVAEFKNTRKHVYRLRVYQRDYAGTSKMIATLCGCVLEIQGSQGDIIAPIVKTQLRFSVVDAWDIADTTTSKSGNWQEFFTPDATLYKVKLSRVQGTIPSETETDIWTGYVTPDSWQEQLDYRGTITITARDNVGHLKDFPFEADGSAAPDENGLVEVRNIINRAMQVIDFPMTFAIEAAGPGQYSADVPCTEDDYYLTEASVNAALFDGMNWYDVLEQTLEAIGYAFRFVGGNKCVVGALRNLPKVGNYSAAVGTQELEFYGGTLELDPAVKKIEEEQDYKQQSEVGYELLKGIVYNDNSLYDCRVEGNTGYQDGSVHQALMNTVQAAGQSAWEAGSGLRSTSASRPAPGSEILQGEGDGWKEYAFICANQVLTSGGTSPTATIVFRTCTANIKIKFRFTPNPLVYSLGTQGTLGYYRNPGYTLASIKYYLMYSDGTTTKYWNGRAWGDSAVLVTQDFDSLSNQETDFEIELKESPDLPDGGEIKVRFGQIIYKCFGDNSGYGTYARLASATAELMATNVLTENKVTTINNEAYNVQLSRHPLFGAMSQEVSFADTRNYLAGLFYYPYAGSNPKQFPYQVRFTDQGATVPLPVLIHQQILCYYYGAARVLNGNCAPVNSAALEFGKLYTYKGNTYLLQGGTVDYFSGIINGAVLREFVDFSDLWDDGAPDYEEEVIYDK